jgi:hypothetical protein
MNSRIAFPFLVLPDETVRFEGWMIGDSGQPLRPARDVLENWDYARDLEVAALVSIDWAAASQALQLPADRLGLKLSLIAGTGIGYLPRRQERLCEFIVRQTSAECRLSGTVLGQNLSGRLQLSLQVSLESPCENGTVLSPKVPGARLWQCQHDILIEDGGDSRFPVETVSFTKLFSGKLQERSPWYLHWQPSALQSDFSACARLYVNSDRPEVLARFVDGDELTLQAIMGDVISQMAGCVLDLEDVAEILAECDEGSVGQQIRQWLDFGFPGQEIKSIKTMRDQSPGVFRAAILAASEFGSSE